MIAQPRILLIERHAEADAALWQPLTEAGFSLRVASGLEEAAREATDLPPDLMLFEVDGPYEPLLDACAGLRSAISGDSALMMIVSPSRNGRSDELGFHLRAGVYVSRAAEADVLVKQIEDLLRLTDPSSDDEVLESQGLKIDRRRHRVLASGTELELTPTEFRLLWSLMYEPGRAFSREELSDTTGRADSLAQKRTIDAHIKSLRKKLDSRADLIETVRSVGYRFKEPIALSAGS